MIMKTSTKNSTQMWVITASLAAIAAVVVLWGFSTFVVAPIKEEMKEQEERERIERQNEDFTRAIRDYEQRGGK